MMKDAMITAITKTSKNPMMPIKPFSIIAMAPIIIAIAMIPFMIIIKLGKFLIISFGSIYYKTAYNVFLALYNTVINIIS